VSLYRFYGSLPKSWAFAAQTIGRQQAIGKSYFQKVRRNFVQWNEYFNGRPVHTVERVVRSTEDMSHNLMWLVGVFLTILLLIAIGNLISGLQPFGSRMGNLFLKINIKHLKPNGSKDVASDAGHLREVRAHSATLITSAKLKKGEHIEIDVSSLPNFPEKNMVLPAKVSHIIPVNGSDSFVTEIRFKRSEGRVIRSLLNYVRRPSRASSSW
jgi:hypothetical protein